VVPALAPLYDYAWFVGFVVAGILHVLLHRLVPVPQPAPSPAHAFTQS
jgi:cytosine/uracil/thiamine/allantoin permease